MLFAYRLALALGQPDPYKMLDDMSLQVFREWIEYYNAEPWANGNNQLAMILSALTGKPFTDFGGIQHYPVMSVEDARSAIALRYGAKA